MHSNSSMLEFSIESDIDITSSLFFVFLADHKTCGQFEKWPHQIFHKLDERYKGLSLNYKRDHLPGVQKVLSCNFKINFWSNESRLE